ncbi:fimbrial biogenesis chaperone [Halomonas halmophila]|uniref:Fimbrial chaperone n=1 Tax=Halomonas halmophila TaxID=252 RepID=A0A4Y4F2X3_9GAMM|nr:fimbria/pilus periplasmic chaperone [Halomonas halmophila]GED23653.1 fimbrial chaperone [Halomonas halmophila]
MKRLLVSLITAATVVLGISIAQGSVVIGGTRVIYPAEKREVSVQLQNSGEEPALVQAWVDSGNPDVSPDNSEAPFVIQPPISRIEPGQGQVLRLSYTGSNPLPKDQESVFWLNVLDVPPNPGSTDGEAPENFLQLAIRSRIKVFYRPEGLEGDVSDAREEVQWSVSGDVLRGNNPTPYHVTVSRLLLTNGTEVSIPTGEGMLAPGESQTFDLPSGAPSSITSFKMTTINDYGARVVTDVSVGR